MAFQPNIVGILCHWCSYSAADAAAGSRLPVPASLRWLRVMCTGRVDPTLVLQAFAAGADGVLICGCHPGDCHYVSGNLRAAARLALSQRLLAGFGIEPERLRLAWVSAQEAERFAAVAREFVAAVATLGPVRRIGALAQRRLVDE